MPALVAKPTADAAKSAFSDAGTAAEAQAGPVGGTSKVRPRRRTLFFAVAAVGLTAFATWAFAVDRQALWQVVNACVADLELTGAPFPCLKVNLAGGRERGYVVLRAPLNADMVLSPTRKVVGVEDPFLQSALAPNYLADAWEARSFLNDARRGAPDPHHVALVVNSAVVRTQDQLHVHIGCLVPAARRALDAAEPKLAVGEWSRIGDLVPHQPFWAFRTGTAALTRVNPFRLVAEGFTDKVHSPYDPADLTVVVTNARIAGAEEFVILASYIGVPHAWWPVGASDLLDPDC
jgi:CDP-diacylglycerol pyrophosphatase